MILPLSPPPSYNCIISPPSPKGESIKIVGFDFFFFFPSLKGNPCPLFDVKVVRFGTAETSPFHPLLKQQTSLPKSELCFAQRTPIQEPAVIPFISPRLEHSHSTAPVFVTQGEKGQGRAPARWGAQGWEPLCQLQSWEIFPPQKSGILQQELTGPHERCEIARPQQGI